MTSCIARRTTVTSYWLWAGCRIRISYNTCVAWQAASFLKIDVLQPRGAALPTSPSGHVSRVLRDWDKREADGDYVGYAQRLLGAAPCARTRPAHRDAGRQLPLF